MGAFNGLDRSARSMAVVSEMNFLADLNQRPLNIRLRHGLEPVGLYTGKGNPAIEVAVAKADAPRSKGDLVDFWKTQRDRRPTPVIAVVLYPGGVSFCGADGVEPTCQMIADEKQVESLCLEVLAQPDHHTALDLFTSEFKAMNVDIPGIRNAGLVFIHHLKQNVPHEDDWNEAGKKAPVASGMLDGDLVHSLGFKATKLDNQTDILSVEKMDVAVAVMLRETESPESGADRFNSLSPVSYALSKADQKGLPWVMLVKGNCLRVYPTEVNMGVGRGGRTEIYIECRTSMLTEGNLPYLWLLCSAQALSRNGSLFKIIRESKEKAGKLATELRERIYDKVIPQLALGIADTRGLRNPDKKELEQTYEMALTVLFRLLFVAYAEDSGLLPLKLNSTYERNSLKREALDLIDFAEKGTSPSKGSFHWHKVNSLWRAVDEGHDGWSVPAYNGGLFSKRADVSPIGAAIANIDIPDIVFGPVLRELLVTGETSEGVLGPVDFSSLNVREFGTIYEGLLESELALADEDMTVDKKGCLCSCKGW